MTRARVAIVGTLDTKGEAVAYLRDRLLRAAVDVMVIDAGTSGRASMHADVSPEDVANAAGASLRELESSTDRLQRLDAMGTGAGMVLARLHARGEVHGAIALGGGQGAALGAAALQRLPLGVPKVLVTSVASGRNMFGPYVGTSDMALFHSVGDIVGVDAVSRLVLANAAAAIAGMVRAEHLPPAGSPIVGMTMLGMTTTGAMAVRELLIARGIDVVPFHANGAGGRCMEELVERGFFRCVVDFSLQEIVGNLFGGLFDGGPQRFTVAARNGVPQVVVPGGTDYLVVGPLHTLSDELRGRATLPYTPSITLVRTSAAEMEAIGHCMAQRLNSSLGSTKVLIPLGGLSQGGVAGGPFHDPDADAALFACLERELRPDIEVLRHQAGINDEAFAVLVAGAAMELAG
jgi:uncharacterized protein (UPF0261 family)